MFGVWVALPGQEFESPVGKISSNKFLREDLNEDEEFTVFSDNGSLLLNKGFTSPLGKISLYKFLLEALNEDGETTFRELRILSGNRTEVGNDNESSNKRKEKRITRRRLKQFTKRRRTVRKILRGRGKKRGER